MKLLVVSKEWFCRKISLDGVMKWNHSRFLHALLTFYSTNRREGEGLAVRRLFSFLSVLFVLSNQQQNKMAINCLTSHETHNTDSMLHIYPTYFPAHWSWLTRYNNVIRTGIIKILSRSCQKQKKQKNKKTKKEKERKRERKGGKKWLKPTSALFCELG